MCTYVMYRIASCWFSIRSQVHISHIIYIHLGYSMDFDHVTLSKKGYTYRGILKIGIRNCQLFCVQPGKLGTLDLEMNGFVR